MRHVVVLCSIAILVGGCPTRNTVTDDTGVPPLDAPGSDVPGMDAPRADAPGMACATTAPEDNVAACTDGCSNDGDTFADCDEGDCCGVVPCVAGTFCGDRPDAGPRPGACDGGLTPDENTAAACTDGCDNDGNGFADCADFACCRVTTCGPTTTCGRDAGPAMGTCDGGTAPENSVAACGDGCDNDGDRFSDCADFGCCALVTCAPTTPCGRRDGGMCTRGMENTVTACTDGCSNDMDAFVDCEDRDCCGRVACATGTFCGDATDGGPPPSCPVMAPENTVAACTDGCSNDGDFFVDCEERDCCGVVTCGATTFCGRFDAGP